MNTHANEKILESFFWGRGEFWSLCMHKPTYANTSTWINPVTPGCIEASEGGNSWENSMRRPWQLKFFFGQRNTTPGFEKRLGKSRAGLSKTSVSQISRELKVNRSNLSVLVYILPGMQKLLNLWELRHLQSPGRDLKSQQTQAQVNTLNWALGFACAEQPGRGGKPFTLQDFFCQLGLYSPGRTDRKVQHRYQHKAESQRENQLVAQKHARHLPLQSSSNLKQHSGETFSTCYHS